MLLVSGLFIVLAARMPADTLYELPLSSLAFLAVLILLARPLAVALVTWGSDLTWRERTLLAWVAPRGIVAAAVSAMFALRLAEAGYPQAEQVVLLTFVVIVGTVLIYGLTAAPLATWLQLATPNPQGILIVGAHPFARAMASTLDAEGYRVLLVDTNWEHIAAARLAGLPATYASILSEEALDELDLGGIGRLLALTSNDEVNALAALHFAEVFGRAQVYQLPPETPGDRRREPVARHLRGRLLFGPEATYTALTAWVAAGAIIKTTPLTPEFDFAAFQTHYGEAALPLFVRTDTGQLLIFSTDFQPAPQPGQTLVSLVAPVTAPVR